MALTLTSPAFEHRQAISGDTRARVMTFRRRLIGLGFLKGRRVWPCLWMTLMPLILLPQSVSGFTGCSTTSQ